VINKDKFFIKKNSNNIPLPANLSYDIKNTIGIGSGDILDGSLAYRPDLDKSTDKSFDIFIANSSGQPVTGTNLILLANPSNVSLQYKKLTNEVFTRAGYVVEHWGEDIDIMSVTGTSSGFYTEQYGLTRQYAKNSLAYANLKSLIMLYRNNGILTKENYKAEILFNDALYNKSNSKLINGSSVRGLSNISFSVTGGSSIRNVPATRRLVGIKYLGNYYYGTFDSFTVSESAADKPFRFDYSFQFFVLFPPDKKPGFVFGHVK